MVSVTYFQYVRRCLLGVSGDCLRSVRGVSWQCLGCVWRSVSVECLCGVSGECLGRVWSCVWGLCPRRSLGRSVGQECSETLWCVRGVSWECPGSVWRASGMCARSLVSVSDVCLERLMSPFGVSGFPACPKMFIRPPSLVRGWLAAVPQFQK